MYGGVSMMNKVTALGVIIAMSVILSSCADEKGSIQQIYNLQPPGWSSSYSETGLGHTVSSEIESAADRLYSQSFGRLKQFRSSPDADTQFCESDQTAVITIYSTNGKARNEIDVKLDGNPIGSLTTYFPDEEPGCKTPSTEGVITIMVPAGPHILEATSSNLNWPSHNFSVDKCECMSLPLS